MVDARLAVTDEGIADLVLSGNDLERDSTLRTAALVSLFTDGRADIEDELPAEDADRRGWWAANLFPEERADFFGSRLWLLSRSKLTNEVLGQAEEFAAEAFDWLLEEGIAEDVVATASRLDGTLLVLEIQLVRGTATEFPEVWEALRTLEVESGSLRVKVLAS